MIEAPRKRGRPKGTGLNDSETLAAIARLRAADPNLKPTTAIRKLGITNPSVVRRLRDKLKVVGEDDLNADPAAPASTSNVIIPADQSPRRTQTRKQRGKRPLPPRPSHATVTTSVSEEQASSPIANQPDDHRPAHQRTSQTQHEPAEAKHSKTQGTISEAKEPRDPESNFGSNTAKPQSHTDHSGALPDPQLEAMRLSAEAAAAVSRLYLHCLTHAAAMSPMAMVLRAQSSSSQWLAMVLAQQALFNPVRKP